MTTVIDQPGLSPVTLRVGQFVWGGQQGAWSEHLVLLEHATARAMAEQILRDLATVDADAP